MSYVSAEDVLPKELIETIQQYVSKIGFGKNISSLWRMRKEAGVCKFRKVQSECQWQSS